MSNESCPHDRVLINSKFHFLPENKILPHFLQMAVNIPVLSHRKTPHVMKSDKQ